MKSRKERKQKSALEGVKLSRRELLTATAATATGLLITDTIKAAETETKSKRQANTDNDTRRVMSVCLACNARCGVRALVKDGKLQEISGNPFHPYNSLGNPLPYTAPLKEGLEKPNPVCGKAHDAICAVYDPYRILKPLKRAGKRGEGKFEPIEWDQLIREIAEGGKLFAHLGEDRKLPGLKDLDSDAPIDPNAPELGPVRNGFIFMTGRLQTGRKAIIDRFVKNAMGSINRIGHTDICGIGFRMGNFALTEQKQVEIKADPWEAEYILVFGANIYEALQPGINTYGAAMAKRHAQGKLKFVIVDPRAQNASVHADDWLPVKPGQDGALAMGMLRWIIENRAYNRRYLEAPSPAAAEKLGHGCYANATHLVIIDPEDPRHHTFLRQKDLMPKGQEKPDNRFMVIHKEKGVVPYDSVESAMLDNDTTVTLATGKQVRVKTAFGLLRQEVMSHSMEEYASLCGIPAEKIASTAKDFTSHGEKAAVCQYHGAGNYAGGTYAAYAVALLSIMTGSIEMRGGYLTSGGKFAAWSKGIYDLKNFPGKRKPGGVRISREKAVYEKSSEYRMKKAKTGSGYPARRPWFAFTKGGLSVESMNGIDTGYPYGCKILFHYFYNPVFSTPGGSRYRQTLADPQKVPLYVSIDTTINESNIFADYIVPDLSWAEGHYGWIHPHAPTCRFTALRTPLIEPLTGMTADRRPYCLETFFIDLATHIGLPGFGEQAIPDKNGTVLPMKRAEDFYLRGFANIAFNAGLPAADPDEQAFVEENYPVARFREILSEDEWKRVCKALARGGIFARNQDQFKGKMFKRGVKRVVLFNEQMAQARNSLTGERYSGTVRYQAPTDSSGRIIAETDSEYPFQIITYKMNVHTQSRTVNHPAAMQIFPENHVIIHEEDASRLGIKDGQQVRVVSRSSSKGIVGRVKVSRLIRKGCTAISFHYGHTCHGAGQIEIKNGSSVFLGGSKVVSGNTLIPDPKRGKGLNFNEIARLDHSLDGLPLVDVQAGIPDFSSTRVRILPV